MSPWSGRAAHDGGPLWHWGHGWHWAAALAAGGLAFLAVGTTLGWSSDLPRPEPSEEDSFFRCSFEFSGYESLDWIHRGEDLSAGLLDSLEELGAKEPDEEVFVLYAPENLFRSVFALVSDRRLVLYDEGPGGRTRPSRRSSSIGSRCCAWVGGTPACRPTGRR